MTNSTSNSRTAPRRSRPWRRSDVLNLGNCDIWITTLRVLCAVAWLLPAAAAADEAKRIVVAGGALTEILYDLGLADRIVGVDTTSLYPAEATKKPNVGYVRQLSAEGVLSLQPDLVIAQEGAGPPDALKLIEQAGVRVERITDQPTPEGVVERIIRVGALTGEATKAEALARSTRERFAKLAEDRGSAGKPVRAMFVMSLQNGRPLVAGRGTGADGMIKLAGGENVADAFEGYKPMTEEAVVAAAPDVIVMMERQGQPLAPADVFKQPALGATPAGESKRLVTMEGLYLLGFGPRAPEAAHDLMVAFYPKLAAPPSGAK
ncbi:heme/hemin ABC transporter substrate-binding protein [Chelatococcus reniformis]|uniref:Hemin ABC transporter substrate-binding protein n=1 Tax=Chelatococcus reniformis TaxID=1494448 RepID=A0A916X7G8_9HYPH|nr:ABC transporter substrate-binding protein [Chelatococcus reniformis]GGC51726.1 hemin ABC transporter substrate-binding protein [Chelatococcus reniformis]